MCSKKPSVAYANRRRPLLKVLELRVYISMVLAHKVELISIKNSEFTLNLFWSIFAITNPVPRRTYRDEPRRNKITGFTIYSIVPSDNFVI